MALCFSFSLDFLQMSRHQPVSVVGFASDLRSACFETLVMSSHVI